MFRTKIEMHARQRLNNGVIFPCKAWSCSRFRFIHRLSPLSRSNLLWWIHSNLIDRCNYLVPHTSWVVEMPSNGGQYHQTIASLWISHLLDNLPLSSVMDAHIASAHNNNPRKITTEPGIMIYSLQSLMFDSMTFALPCSLFILLTSYTQIFSFQTDF